MLRRSAIYFCFLIKTLSYNISCLPIDKDACLISPQRVTHISAWPCDPSPDQLTINQRGGETFRPRPEGCLGPRIASPLPADRIASPRSASTATRGTEQEVDSTPGNKSDISACLLPSKAGVRPMRLRLWFST